MALLGYYMEELGKHLKSGETKQLWRQYCDENNIDHEDKTAWRDNKKLFAKYVSDVIDRRAKESYIRDNPINESEETK